MSIPDPLGLPQPTQINLPKDVLERDYLYVHVDRIPDPCWQFKLNLHRDTRISTEGGRVPTVAEPFQTLALFQRPDPLADIEIFGLNLPAEIDPADWLDLWLEKHGLSVASAKRLATPRGVLGDFVCTWDTAEGPFAGRFVTLRWGRRFFLLSLRTPRQLYPRIADDFFLAVASFGPVDVDERNLNAETHQIAPIGSPVEVKVSLPASYALKMEMSDEQASGFNADQLPVADLPDDPAFGKLSFIVARRDLADHPAKAAGFYIDALLKNPVTLHESEFREEQGAPNGFQQSWLLVAPATLAPPGGEPTPVEVRCRVMVRDDAWFVAGTLGPARNAAPIAWMRNKRALDLVSTTATF
jgi:hypothetical protein